MLPLFRGSSKLAHQSFDNFFVQRFLYVITRKYFCILDFRAIYKTEVFSGCRVYNFIVLGFSSKTLSNEYIALENCITFIIFFKHFPKVIYTSVHTIILCIKLLSNALQSPQLIRFLW